MEADMAREIPVPRIIKYAKKNTEDWTSVDNR